MQLFVKSDRTHCLEVSPDASVSQLLAAFEERTGFPADEARVIFAGKQLEENALLSSCGVEQEATLQILGRLLGGAKKRKKKTYTKPKKNKHVHKKVKLRVLKFYKVDDSGKVERLRKVCPNHDCGAGIFMATHVDRVYCGKCSLTYWYADGKDKDAKAAGKKK